MPYLDIKDTITVFGYRRANTMQSGIPASMCYEPSYVSPIFKWELFESPIQLKITSALLNTSIGSGIHIIRIEGLKYVSDNEWIPWYEDIALNGNTPILTTETAWIRINTVYPIRMGAAFNPSQTSTGHNIIIRTITDDIIGYAGDRLTPFTASGHIPGIGGIFTVPDGYKADIKSIVFTQPRTDNSTVINLIARERNIVGGNNIGVFYPHDEFVTFRNKKKGGKKKRRSSKLGDVKEGSSLPSFYGGTDLEIRVVSKSNSGTSDASAYMNIGLIKL